jgi:hypothetical protein
VSNAEDRAWEVVRKAYLERPPAPARHRRGRVLLATAAVACVAAAVLSPPGHAVFEQLREAVGVQRVAPALLGLPAQGRILVVSAEHGGVWLVHSNGYKRRLGSYDDAEWSPFGRFVVATTSTSLDALDVNDQVRWTLRRPAPMWPRWGGTRTDTRIAYVDRTGLRVVAGDGTGDHLIDRFGGLVAPAWDPARKTALAYYSGGAIVLADADTGRILWRTNIRVLPTALVWSDDGRKLVVLSARGVLVFDGHGRLQGTDPVPGFPVAAVFRPGSHELAVSLRLKSRSEVRLVDADVRRSRLVFAGPGTFGDLAWSPNRQWLLVTWPSADQWVFVRGTHVRAVGNIREQFPRADHLGPMLEVNGRWFR